MRWAIGKPGHPVRMVMDDHGSPYSATDAQLLAGETIVPIGDRRLSAGPVMPVDEESDFTWPTAVHDEARAVRALRDALLIQSDWTQVADVPLADGVRAKWAAYRQALRDLPAQQPNASVETATWPDKPA